MARDGELTKTITGIVYPARKDSKGNVISLVIDSLDNDQDGYMISPGKMANELLKAINKKVEACGFILEDDKGNLTIKVKNYKIFEDI